MKITSTLKEIAECILSSLASIGMVGLVIILFFPALIDEARSEKKKKAET